MINIINLIINIINNILLIYYILSIPRIAILNLISTVQHFVFSIFIQYSQ